MQRKKKKNWEKRRNLKSYGRRPESHNQPKGQKFTNPGYFYRRTPEKIVDQDRHLQWKQENVLDPELHQEDRETIVTDPGLRQEDRKTIATDPGLHLQEGNGIDEEPGQTNITHVIGHIFIEPYTLLAKKKKVEYKIKTRISY